MRKKRKKCLGCGSIKKPIKRGTPCGHSFTECPKCGRMRTATWLRRGK